jgi:hypothetical protein
MPSLQVIHSNYSLQAKTHYAQSCIAKIEEWRKDAIKKMKKQ